MGDDIGGRLLSEALRERGVGTALTVDREARTGAMLVVREAVMAQQGSDHKSGVQQR